MHRKSIYTIWLEKYGEIEAKRRELLRLGRMSKSLKGKKAWNEGLTKSTDNRVKKSGQKLSKTRRKLFEEGKLKSWITGLSKDTDKRVMQLSRKLSGISKSKEHIAKMVKTIIDKGINAGENNNCFGKFGLNHPAWKGDKSKGILRDKIYGSYRYKNWRKLVFERDNYTCQNCRKRGGHIEAHHKKAYSVIMKNIANYNDAMKCEELWNTDNGETLCRSCHKKTFIFFGNQHINNLVVNANEVNSGKILTSNVEDNPEPSPKGKVRRSELK